MPKNRKIEINQSQPAGLNSAFSSLEIGGLPEGQIVEPQAKAVKKPKLGRVVLRKETAHRGGKTVIVAYDFATHLSLSYIADLGRKLKSACGCGGTVKERTIEIQGDQAGKIRALLEEEGFQVAGVR